MKKLKALSCFILLFLTFSSYAQKNEPPLNTPDYNKPKIFADLPDMMVVDQVSLTRIFGLKTGDPVNLQLTSEFQVKGTIVSNGESNGVHTVIMRLPARNNAILSISRISESGAYRYTGRVISRENGDALILKKMDEQIVLTKTGFYDLISE